MSLPACACCGRTDPRRMIGLMTLWFGPFADIRPDHGYFHLCPDCYLERIQPHFEQVQGRLFELHPLARHLGLHRTDPAEEEADDAEGEAQPTRPARRPIVAAGAADGPEPA